MEGQGFCFPELVHVYILDKLGNKRKKKKEMRLQPSRHDGIHLLYVYVL